MRSRARLRRLSAARCGLLKEVAANSRAVFLESTGDISVLSGATLDETLLEGVTTVR